VAASFNLRANASWLLDSQGLLGNNERAGRINVLENHFPRVRFLNQFARSSD
jgi:hypothetical protein